jgi:putative flavoprotein involved in K+ transport
MKRTDTIIIGGGQAGLAMSRCLTEEGIDHAVLERGRVAERWRSERWDSLRLLSPKWHTRLPGFRYQGADRDGFMTMPELISYLERYAKSFSAPVEEETTVLGVERAERGYRVRTDQGDWQAPNVVVATGHCDVPFVPKVAAGMPSHLHQVVPSHYKNADDLPNGGVLVVGASASGIQLAQEIHRSGRPVTLAVGRHTRIPRRYRGRDIAWWLEASGILHERAERAFDLESARRQPSLQLVGTPDHRTIDLGVLQEEGVRLAGRFESTDGTRVGFAGDLGRNMDAAERKLDRLLERIDAFIDETRMSACECKTRESRPSCGPRDTAAAIRGSTCQSSTSGEKLFTTLVSRRPPASTRSGSISNERASRASSMASATMPASSQRTSLNVSAALRSLHRSQDHDHASHE